MKCTLIFVCILLLATSLVATAGPVLDLLRDEWTQFKLEHRKLYNSESEEEDRLKIYLDTRRMIAKHNQRYEFGLETYEMGLNQFSDMLYEEFLQQFTGAAGMPLPDNHTSTADNAVYLTSSELFEAPASIDWRSKGDISAIKSQGGCGSCWAFATVAVLEAHIKIHKGKSVRLSEQMLLDCAPNSGCTLGGSVIEAFDYITENGIAGDDYPEYDATQHQCRYDSNMNAATISGYKQVFGEDNLKSGVGSVGPLTVHFHVTEKFKHYRQGVFYDPSCPKQSNHAIIAVGYESFEDKDMWIIKNSWGTTWGEQGFGYVARNVDQCGIGSYSEYPIL